MAAFCFTLALAGCERARTPPARPPDVILITLDTTRADRLGCYGYDRGTSPALDTLASLGTVFELALAQAAVTPVSHASILTGLDPYHHGLRVMHGTTQYRLPDSIPTLATVLRERGYATGAFVSAFPVTQRFGLQRGFDVFDAAFLAERPGTVDPKDGAVTTGLSQQRAEVTTNNALAWLDRVTGPVLLWVHYFDPHDDTMLPPESVLDRATLPAEPEARLREIYDREIRYMDSQIRRLLRWLETSGRSRNSVVVAVADHGEGLGDHGWWPHGKLYQEQIRVPLIVRAPHKPAGRRVPYLVRTTDVMPTILDLAGVDRRSQPRMDGRSLVPLLDGASGDPGWPGYADAVSLDTFGVASLERTYKMDDGLFVMVEGRWKYIHHWLRPEESEMYDLLEDPRELRNRIGDQPAVADRLKAAILALHPVPSARTPQEGEALSDADRERLRSLGYQH